MSEKPAARGVTASDLGSYQYAVRLVLTNDLITGTRPRAGALGSVLRWADVMARDFSELLGYTLIATAQQVRLLRRFDTLDASQRTVFATRGGRPFDRRRLSYLCLMLSVFQRSRIEISLADLVRAFAPAAGAIGGLGFDATITEHKRAVVDVLDWLTDHDALRLSDGSAESWAHDSEAGDALYDIDHDICSLLFRPPRPVQLLGGAAGLLDRPGTGHPGAVSREAAARRARRLLIEHPVAYYANLDNVTATALRGTELADNLARLTGLVVERRAEGVMLVDPTGRFTDLPFPGRGSAVNRAAGLLLAKVADILEDPEAGPTLPRVPVPSAAEDLSELMGRIDAGTAGQEQGAGNSAGAEQSAGAEPLAVPFVDQTRAERMVEELYELFGPASFTAQWQNDPYGLLGAALVLLDDLGLARQMPGGVAILPAAARYRNITAALPDGGRRAGQGRFVLSDLTSEATG